MMYIFFLGENLGVFIFLFQQSIVIAMGLQNGITVSNGLGHGNVLT